jgi:hypothetical protein
MLDTERELFEQRREQLLAEHPGKFVLIKESEVVGAFNTIEEAIAEGARRFGLQPFLVRQIVPAGPADINIPALQLGLLSANSTRPI